MFCMPPWQEPRLACHASMWHQCQNNKLPLQKPYTKHAWHALHKAASRLRAYPPPAPRKMPPSGDGV